MRKKKIYLFLVMETHESMRTIRSEIRILGGKQKKTQKNIKK